MSDSAAGQTGTDCWNRIGVRGDRSCERLPEHAHCRNCDVFSAASGAVMQRAVPDGYRRDWAAHFARPRDSLRLVDQSVMVFRIGREWLALPSQAALAAIDSVTPRRLPHRSDPVLLGLANVRGRLLPCLSLARLLQIDDSEPHAAQASTMYPRMLAVQFVQLDAVLPVAEVWGLHRFAQQEIEAPPTAATLAAFRYINGVLSVGDMRIGILDADLLGVQFVRHLK